MITLSDTPRVRHYRRAEEELAGWDVRISTSALDQHVACQLSDLSYVRADEMTDYEYAPYMDAIIEATVPERMRVDGTGPWTLTQCACCRRPDCILLCTCRPAPCAATQDDPSRCSTSPSGEGQQVVFREMTVRDYHRVAPYHLLDQYALVELLTGGDVDEWPWGLYRTVLTAIQRSRRNPTWPRSAGPPSR